MKSIPLLLISLLLLLCTPISAAKKPKAPSREALMLAEADSLMQHYNYFHASKIYRSLYDSLPTPLVTRKLANVYRRMGRNDESAALLRTIPQDSVTYDDVRASFLAYRNIENKDSLLFYGDKVLRMNPYDSEVVVQMATYCNANNFPQKAFLLCRQYDSRDSTNLLVVKQMGYAAYLMEFHEDALKCYTKLLDAGFDNYESAFIIGISLERMGKMEEAYPHLKKAVEYKDFRDYLTLYHLGKVCMAIGMCDEAVGNYQKAISIEMPDSSAMSVMYIDMAEAYTCRHKYLEAAHALEQSMAFAPDKPLTYYNIAQMYGALKDAKKARQYYTLFLEKSSQMKPTDENKELVDQVKEWLKKK